MLSESFLESLLENFLESLLESFLESFLGTFLESFLGSFLETLETFLRANIGEHQSFYEKLQGGGGEGCRPHP